MRDTRSVHAVYAYALCRPRVCCARGAGWYACCAELFAVRGLTPARAQGRTFSRTVVSYTDRVVCLLAFQGADLKHNKELRKCPGA